MRLLPLCTLAILTILFSCNHKMSNSKMEGAPQSIYQFKVPSIEGGTIDFSKFKGKKILVVNTASKCGYTPQYEGLEKLYKENKDKLVVVGFPANDFGGQEPGTNEEIQEFCKVRYGVTFPLASKVDVVGENIHPVYKWLTSKEQNGVLDATIKWNFNKFMLDENGKMLEYFPSKALPNGEEITKYLK
ncbi:glutathione peroxidase [Segetibacter sp. 3557_3]|nr:glutathione peroxidase [Segetibacter sp. 3557_3]